MKFPSKEIAALLLALLPAAAPAQQFCLCLPCLDPALDVWRARSDAMAPLIAPGDCVVTRRTATPAAIPPGTVVLWAEPETGEVRFARLVAPARSPAGDALLRTDRGGPPFPVPADAIRATFEEVLGR